MSLGQDTAPKSPDLTSENDFDDALMSLDEFKGLVQHAKQGLGYLVNKVDEHKRIFSGIASGVGALWAAYEIYQNPAEITRFVSHTQLPTMMVDSLLVTLGMGMTGVPVATALYGGKALTQQISGRKRTANQAELAPAPAATQTKAAEPLLPQEGIIENETSVPNNELKKPQHTYTPGVNISKRRKLTDQSEDIENNRIVFKTPRLSPFSPNI